MEDIEIKSHIMNYLDNLSVPDFLLAIDPIKVELLNSALQAIIDAKTRQSNELEQAQAILANEINQLEGEIT